MIQYFHRAIGCQYDPSGDRVDWLVGYRYIDLDEQLRLNENIESLIIATPGTLAVGDSFRTQNEFNGLQLGVIYNANFRKAWLESSLRVAVGHNTVAGRTTLSIFTHSTNCEI